VIAEVPRRYRGRITLASSFWINCAERHLTDYLGNTRGYPPDGWITVDQLAKTSIWRDDGIPMKRTLKKCAETRSH
jgi:hypothetical protein